MADDQLLDLRHQLSRELTHNILPFYMGRAVDATHGGFYGLIANDLTVDEQAPKGLIQNTRILWAFARAYRVLGDAAYRATAERAYEYLLRCFWDAPHDGFHWMVSFQGEPLESFKMVYGQAFAIYSLAEYVLATGSQQSLERAIALYQLLEQHAADPVHGGYFETCSRDWSTTLDLAVDTTDLPVAKSMNTHLHMLEAYTNLLAAWDAPELRDSLRALIRVTLDHIVNRETGHFVLHCSADWQPLSAHVSYGHDIEGSWLLLEAAQALGDQELLTEVEIVALQMADVTLAEGIDDDGGVFNEGDAEGIINDQKDWWPQAEAMVGFINAYQLLPDARYRSAALASWRFIDRFIIDHQHGEWFWGVTCDGVPLDLQKSGPWKGPYHNGRACMEIMHRVDTLCAS